MKVATNWKEITPSDCQAVERIRSASGSTCATLIFPNLYLWQEEYKLTLRIEPEMFAVKFGAAGDNDYFAPCGEPEAKREFVQELLDSSPAGLRFHYLFENDRQFLTEYFPDRFVFTETPQHAEYILDTHAHALMQGSRYANIRMEIHRVSGQGMLHIKELTPDCLDEAWDILGRWEKQRLQFGIHTSSLQPARQSLSNLEELGMHCCMMYCNTTPVGFYLGTTITDDVADALVEICMQGSAMEYYMLTTYCRYMYDKGYQWVNIEEDLGIPGLRMRKQKNRPARIEQAWRCEAL